MMPNLQTTDCHAITREHIELGCVGFIFNSVLNYLVQALLALFLFFNDGTWLFPRYSGILSLVTFALPSLCLGAAAILFLAQAVRLEVWKGVLSVQVGYLLAVLLHRILALNQMELSFHLLANFKILPWMMMTIMSFYSRDYLHLMAIVLIPDIINILFAVEAICLTKEVCYFNLKLHYRISMVHDTCQAFFLTYAWLKVVYLTTAKTRWRILVSLLILLSHYFIFYQRLLVIMKK